MFYFILVTVTEVVDAAMANAFFTVLRETTDSRGSRQFQVRVMRSMTLKATRSCEDTEEGAATIRGENRMVILC